ncbi:MAG: GrpB family protein [Candidatus Cloacimonetes bacterium]|nr:GrpB family protein [Candidatus Cloacimonadota bacterium]
MKPEFAHNLYVCIEGSIALNNHLTLRDHLRSNPNDCMTYGQLKSQLAMQFPNDIDSYCEAKSQFILKILNQYGFDIRELDEIESSNLVNK